MKHRRGGKVGKERRKRDRRHYVEHNIFSSWKFVEFLL